MIKIMIRAGKKVQIKSSLVNWLSYPELFPAALHPQAQTRISWPWGPINLLRYKKCRDLYPSFHGTEQWTAQSSGLQLDRSVPMEQCLILYLHLQMALSKEMSSRTMKELPQFWGWRLSALSLWEASLGDFRRVVWSLLQDLENLGSSIFITQDNLYKMFFKEYIYVNLKFSF